MKRSKGMAGLLQAGSVQSLTKTALALRELRIAIRSGKIPQGEQLTVGELAEQLGMSPTPVREAMRTLQAEGLITQTPHHTLAVITLSEKDVQDIYVVRLLVEPLATQLATPHLTEADFAQLHQLNVDMHEADLNHRMDRRYELNHDWHFTLYACAQNRVLLNTITALWQRFLWRTSWAMPDHADVSYAHHLALLDALRARDADRAGQLMTAHIINGQRHALCYLHQQFADAQ